MRKEIEISVLNSHPTDRSKQASGCVRQECKRDVRAGDVNVSG